jgi:two-component system LytT family response regulator
VVGNADSIGPAEELIRKMKPDLVFLDVEMPFGNGFDLLEKFEKINFSVIFSTAYDHYAVKAIKINALDYLLKPVDINDLKIAVGKVEGKLKESNSDTTWQLEALLNNIKEKGLVKKIAVPSLNGLTFINIEEIVRCESDVNYTNIFLTDRKKITVSKPLKEYEELLSEYNFFRIHNSALINMIHVKQYIKGEGGYLVMSDGVSVEVSRRKKAEFLDKFAIK